MLIKKVFNLKLDLNGRSVHQKIIIRRNDYDVNVFAAQVLQNGAPYDISGLKPVFECITPSGYFVRDDGSQYGNMKVTDAANGKIEYTLINKVFASIGAIETAYFVFEESDSSLENPVDRMSTGNINFSVINDALEGHMEAGNYLSELNVYLQTINDLKEQVSILQAQVDQLQGDV